MIDSTAPDQATTKFDGHSVIAVSFEEDSNAYRALTSLKELDTQDRIRLEEAVVVVRGEDGQLTVKDRIDSPSMLGTASGGLTGLLVGIIGGPLGVLIGGTYGLLVGSLFDLYDLGATESSLAAISSSARLGHTSLLAVAVEQSPEVVDTTMAGVGGKLVRRPVAEVQAEIAAAEGAERKAKREARKELVRGRQEKTKAAVDAKVDELKAKLRGGQRDGDAARASAAGGSSR
jgi:uncharacterized membrane protein